MPQHPANPTTIKVRSFGAECVGTYVLVLVAAGIPAFASGNAAVSELAPIFPGLTVLALIYTLADTSGAHFNPVVTLAFAVRRDFPWRMVPGYLLSQFAGAFLAAATILCMVGPSQLALGANIPPDSSTITALASEIVLTAVLVLVILCTATGARIVGHNAALAVGSTIAVCGLLGAPFGAGSMNPARSLAPAILAGNLDAAWVFIVGPVVGAAIGVAITWLLKGRSHEHEQEAAAGNVLEAYPEEK